MQEHYKKNTYYLVRHGEAENNVLGLLSSLREKKARPYRRRTKGGK